MSALVLVVDDDPAAAGELAGMLAELGYRTVPPVAAGEDALQAIGVTTPALVLLDVELEGAVDGIATAHAIRARYGTPVIYLTSHADHATQSRAKETEPYGYLLRPFAAPELRTAIEVALHKHALETQLATRERWFTATVPEVGELVLGTDRSETITFLNVVAERSTGWRREDAIGTPLAKVVRLIAADGDPPAGPIRIAYRREFTAELPGSRVVVFRDVTERTKLEHRLAHAERLASLGTLAAGIGHEINNPLVAVVANLEFATDAATTALHALGGSVVEPALAHAQLRVLLDALADASAGAERVRSIVQDLRRFARAEVAASQALELSDVVEAALDATAAERPAHVLVIKEFGTTPFVIADEGRLTQVFANLLTNACQAITAGAREAHEIRVRTATDAAGRAVAEITDTGPGIAPEVLPRIFDPFFTTKRVGQGMGLGLAICHDVVASLGGEITAESSARGASFRISLPPARPPAKTQSIRIPVIASGAPRAKVLVIDDEAVVVRSLQRILSKLHDVEVAVDGAAALALIARTRYDMILCDLMMPNMSGVDLYEAVASANPEQARRMVFMTGGAFTARTQAFLDATKNRYLLKPFSAAAIKAIAAEITGERP